MHKVALNLTKFPIANFKMEKLSVALQDSVLPVTLDQYLGISVKLKEKTNPRMFENQLADSLHLWKSNGARLAWLNIPKDSAELIPVCVQHGFEFHHVGLSSELVMTQWLSKDEENNIPNFATHHVGVGGMVINKQNSVLVVKERFTSRPHWHLPGGLVDQGEKLDEAVEREVFEETGVKGKFRSVISFRHQRAFKFGCSDLYFVCLMEPVSEQISRDSQEIADVTWMPFEDYKKRDDVTKANREFARIFDEQRRQGIRTESKQVISFMGTDLTDVYFPVVEKKV